MVRTKKKKDASSSGSGTDGFLLLGCRSGGILRAPGRSYNRDAASFPASSRFWTKRSELSVSTSSQLSYESLMRHESAGIRRSRRTGGARWIGPEEQGVLSEDPACARFPATNGPTVTRYSEVFTLGGPRHWLTAPWAPAVAIQGLTSSASAAAHRTMREITRPRSGFSTRSRARPTLAGRGRIASWPGDARDFSRSRRSHRASSATVSTRRASGATAPA